MEPGRDAAGPSGSTDLGREQNRVHQLLPHLPQAPHPLQTRTARGVKVHSPQRGGGESLEGLLKVSPRQTRTC